MSADLVDSRLARGRADLARRIERALGAINQRWEDDWIAGLESTRGLDELSGVLGRACHAFDVMAALNLAVWPHRFRFAVATGPLDVIGDSGRASDMDGPAFHRAANGLQRSRDTGLPLAVELQGRGEAARDVVESLAKLYETITGDWTESVARVVQVSRPLDGDLPTQQAVAHALGLTQQAVSDSHRRGHLKTLVHAEDAIRSWLDAQDEVSGA